MDIIEVDYEPFSLMNDIASIVNSRIGDKDVVYIMDIPKDIPCRLIGDNIRIQQILINMLNNEELYWTVLEKYYRAIDKKAAVIREYWKSGDIENYTIEVHSLKSTSKQIGS